VAHLSRAATSWCQTPLRKCDFRSTGGELDEPIPGQGFDRLVVEISQRSLRLRDQAQGLCAALPEGAFVAGLLPKRFVSPTAGGAAGRERAGPAARNSGQTDGRTEIHQRLRGRGRKAVAGAFLDTVHVRVYRQDVSAQRKVPDRRSGVGPDPGQLGQIVGPTARRDPLRGPVEVQATPVVAKSLPNSNDLRRRSRRECFGRGPALEPVEVPRDDPLHLSLLQHHLRDEDRVRVSRTPPRQIAAVLREPGEQDGFHGPGL
jgi:hypothetical protein